MKKIIILIFYSLLFISCKNNDVEIKILNETCGYNNQISSPDRLECNSNTEIYQKAFYETIRPTHSVVLKNKSQTKVYKILIQVNRNRNITYQEYNIQPTETIDLGCDRDYDVNVRYDSYSGTNYPSASELSAYKIIYKIHKVELISEY
jgi:hypothetical protein